MRLPIREGRSFPAATLLHVSPQLETNITVGKEEGVEGDAGPLGRLISATSTQTGRSRHISIRTATRDRHPPDGSFAVSVIFKVCTCKHGVP